MWVAAFLAYSSTSAEHLYMYISFKSCMQHEIIMATTYVIITRLKVMYKKLQHCLGLNSKA